MRAVPSVIFLCALFGCSAAPEWIVPLCRHDSDDCSPDAVRSRVLESFPDVNVQEVIACADEPAMFCNSGIPDEEACLVRLEGEAPAANGGEGAKTSTRLLSRLVSKDVPRYQRTLWRKHIGGHGPPGEASIYVNSRGNLAVLYLEEARCFDISEIT